MSKQTLPRSKFPPSSTGLTFVTIFALTVPLASLLQGCGGGSSDAVPAVIKTAMPAQQALANDGALQISVPTLAAEVSRVLPDKGRFLKIEIFDIQNGDPPVRVAIPLELQGGDAVKPEANSTFVVIDRTADSAVPSAQQKSATFVRLPVKNLVLRVTAFNGGTEKSPSGNVLAQAEVSFTPERKKPDGSGETRLSFTLDTNITELAISGDGSIEQDENVGSAVEEYTLIAKVGNDIALLPVDNILAARNVNWTHEYVSGSGSAQDLGALLVDDADRAGRKKSLTTRLTAKLFPDGVAVKYGIVRITARDEESGRVAVKEVRIAPKPAPLNLDIANAPFGTRSVRIIVDPTDDQFADNLEVVRLLNGEVLRNAVGEQRISAGAATVSVTCYSGENGDGIALREAFTRNVFIRPNVPATETVGIPADKVTPVVVWVIDGDQRPLGGKASGEEDKPLDEAKPITQTYSTNPAKEETQAGSKLLKPLLAGKSYRIQVRAGSYRYPATAFDLTPVTQETVPERQAADRLGSVSPIPNFSDRYNFSLPSNSQNKSYDLEIKEKIEGRLPRKTERAYTVLSDTAQAIIKVK